VDDKLKQLGEYLVAHHCGESKSIKSKDLVSLKYASCIRDIRVKIHDLREHGYPICSGPDGYYMASKQSDLESTINILKSHVKSLNETIDGLTKLYNEV